MPTTVTQAITYADKSAASTDPAIGYGRAVDFNELKTKINLLRTAFTELVQEVSQIEPTDISGLTQTVSTLSTTVSTLSTDLENLSDDFDNLVIPTVPADLITSTGSPVAITKTWAGTQAQYDAITTKDPNTIYHFI